MTWAEQCVTSALGLEGLGLESVELYSLCNEEKGVWVLA